MISFDTLLRWNLWGSWIPEAGHQREITDTLCQYVAAEEVIALIGPRRAGKSTVMYQLMQYLQNTRVDPKAILHINFEEPELTSYLKPGLLDEIYSMYRSRVFPKGKAYLFLDEIQNLPEWERWVRARNETEDIKIFLTGSSASLMSRELATLLTGRNLTFDIHPLSFKELLDFKNIKLPNGPLPYAAPAEIKHELMNYLEWGGFPRVVLAKDNNEREILLKRYLDEMIFKDLALRHQIRDMIGLRNIVFHLLTNTASLVSYKRLANIFEVSPDLVRSYINYLVEAFLIEALPIHSAKAAERQRNPLKIHAVDLGLRKILNFSESPDWGKLLETTVHNELRRNKKGMLSYSKQEGEIDLVLQEGNNITQLIQVAYVGLDDPKIFARESSSLNKTGLSFSKAKKTIISWEVPLALQNKKAEDIEVIPLWHFLCG